MTQASNHDYSNTNPDGRGRGTRRQLLLGYYFGGGVHTSQHQTRLPRNMASLGAAEAQRYASSGLMFMKRRILIAGMVCLAVFGLILAANWQVVSMFISRAYMGRVSESWETSNTTLRLRIDRHTEENAWAGGAYYVFQSAPSGSESWHKIMTFRHDDPNPIPRDQVHFVNDQVAFVFMGWMYAVTKDGGRSWSVWNAERDLPKWDCCNYRLIATVNIEASGTGTMILNPIPQRQGEVRQLHTKDFGQHWNL